MEEQSQEDQAATLDVQPDTIGMAGKEQTAPAMESSQPSTEAPISFGGYDPSPSYGYQPTPVEGNNLEVAGEVEGTTSQQPGLSYGQSYEPPASAEGDDGTASYQSPSFNGYEPPSSGYQPYEPDTPASPAETKPKKKGIMDLSDDEDDMSARAASLKRMRRHERTKRPKTPFDVPPRRTRSAMGLTRPAIAAVGSVGGLAVRRRNHPWARNLRCTRRSWVRKVVSYTTRR